jgi:uncharacterized protein YjbI with pentapeptide repeats
MRLAIAAIVLLMGFFGPIYRVVADTEPAFVRLGPWAADLMVGPDMNATGMRLWGTLFSGQDLTNSIFDDCDLTNVTFRQCNLTGVSFRRCVMSGMVLDDCILSNNDVTDAVINGLVGGEGLWNRPQLSIGQIRSTLSFQRRDLSDCDLRLGAQGYVDASQLDLSGFRLDRTGFAFADLTKVNFEGAYIYSPKFHQCKIDLDSFQKAKVVSWRNSVLASVEFAAPPDFSKQNLSGAELGVRFVPSLKTGSLQGATISRAHIGGNLLSGSTLLDTRTYQSGLLFGIQFVGCDFSDVDFSRRCIVSCSFDRCNLTDANFNQTVISGVTFSDPCKGLTAAQIRSTWNFQQERMELVQLPDSIRSELKSSTSDTVK